MVKHAGGRPKIEIDYKIVDKLSQIACTQEEIASILGCSVDTLQRDIEFCGIYKDGLNKARASLRRKQFALADKNAAMAIFLGKNMLKQRDNIDIEHSGTINNPFEGLTTDELREILEKNG
jgi:hypothetical protein